MKILAIIGSPRKGNSYQATAELEKKLKLMGDYEFEYLFLKDAHLETCRGCFNCLSRGDEFCPLKDDKIMIEKKMMEADGLILVSPVYVINVTAIMKNFIDRFAYICHRPVFHGKKALVLSTTGGMGLKETMNYMETIAEIWGYDVVDKCGLITPPFPLSEKMKKKNDKKIQKACAQFDKSLKSMDSTESKTSSVKFNSYLTFRIFQRMSQEVGEYMPADNKFYKGKKYYQPAKIGILQKIVTEIMVKVIFFMMRDMGPVKEEKIDFSHK